MPGSHRDIFCVTPDWLANGILVMDSIGAHNGLHNNSQQKHGCSSVKRIPAFSGFPRRTPTLEELVADVCIWLSISPCQNLLPGGRSQVWVLSGRSGGVAWQARLTVSHGAHTQKALLAWKEVYSVVGFAFSPSRALVGFVRTPERSLVA